MTSSEPQLVFSQRTSGRPPSIEERRPVLARRPPGSRNRPVSEREHARQRCLDVLAGTSSVVRSLLVDVNRDVATLILAAGDQPIFIWRFDVLLASSAGWAGLRAAASRMLDEARLFHLAGSVEQIVVAEWTAAAGGSALFGELVRRLGAVPVRRAEHLASA